MRTLLLLRHAKSSWDDPGLADRDRPLAPRGIKAARRIAKHLQSEGIRPELVVCSPARRTRETLELLRPGLGSDTSVQVEDDLYGAGVSELVERLRRVDPATASVMVVGHNPAMQDLALALAGGGDDAALTQLRTKFPTAALATLEVSADWQQLAPGQARLVSVVLPKQLG